MQANFARHRGIPKIALGWKQPGWHVNYVKYVTGFAPGFDLQGRV